MAYTQALATNRSDLRIEGGKLVMTTGTDEIAQRILITLRHFWWEYWLNLQGGVPWYELILGGKDRKMAEAILRKIVMGVPGVLGIIKFNPAFTGRAFSISMLVEVNKGTINLNTVLP